MSVSVLGSRLLVKELEEDNITGSGLIVSQFRDPRIKRAEIQVVGPGEVSPEGVLIPVDSRLEPGVVVYYDSYGSPNVDITIEGEQYVIIDEEIVMAIDG